MRNLVLIALVLQLLLTLTEANEEYQFGDIISFKRNCICKIGPSYKHFAVYVGDENLPGKQAGQEIFHHTGKPWKNGVCGFGVLEKQGERAKVDNYLDKCFKGETFTPDRAQMIERIKYWNNPANCGTYGLFTNNCEHLATHVRYNITNLLQPGTTAGLLFILTDKCKKLLEAMEENKRLSDGCHNNCSSSDENAVTKSQPHPTTNAVPIVVVVLLCILLLVVVYVVLRRRRVISPTTYIDL